MLSLTEKMLEDKLSFIDRYMTAQTAADGSSFDANANISSKNIATLEYELNKDINIQINRELMRRKLDELFGPAWGKEYIRQLEQHEIYVHDETSMKPYCVSASLYPFLLHGLRTVGGESGPPKHLDSFCGSFINLVFAISSQFAGAVATVEFLTYFDYFARMDLGQDYLDSHESLIHNRFQQIVYSINQPAAARGYQAVFWNISIFDQHYFKSIFTDFVFPDYSKPDWESVRRLQKAFMQWLNAERQRAILTFPVITAAMLVDESGPIDRDFADFCASELAAGNAFFVYQSRSVDSLASCCRLRNAIEDQTFSYSLGAGGVATGSIKVITLNVNRMIQDGRSVAEEVDKIRHYLIAYRHIVQEYLDAEMLPIYSAGYISLQKQFLTIGLNGIVEAAEFLGLRPTPNAAYQGFLKDILAPIAQGNRDAATRTGYRFNTELVPAENLGVKNAAWDRKDGYQLLRDVYNSYLYAVEDHKVNILDKFLLHGQASSRLLDGGAALHLNLQEHLSAAQYRQLFGIAARSGCNYFCTNVKITICNDCGQIDKQTRQSCSACGSRNIDYGTRIIGYLKRVSAFSKPRRVEQKLRYYHREQATYGLGRSPDRKPLAQ